MRLVGPGRRSGQAGAHPEASTASAAHSAGRNTEEEAKPCGPAERSEGPLFRGVRGGGRLMSTAMLPGSMWTKERKRKVCRQRMRSVGEPTELLGENAAPGVLACPRWSLCRLTVDGHWTRFRHGLVIDHRAAAGGGNVPLCRAASLRHVSGSTAHCLPWPPAAMPSGTVGPTRATSRRRSRSARLLGLRRRRRRCRRLRYRRRRHGLCHAQGSEPRQRGPDLRGVAGLHRPFHTWTNMPYPCHPVKGKTPPRSAAAF